MKRRLFLLLPLLALPLFSSCILVAGAGAGYLISQKVLPNDVRVAQVALDVDQVWPSARETLGFHVDPGTELTVQEFPRQIEAKIDGARVRVAIEAHDLDRTLIRVQAEKFFANDDTTARRVMDSILDRLSEE